MGAPWTHFGTDNPGSGRDEILDSYLLRIKQLSRIVVEMKSHAQRVTHNIQWALEQLSAAQQFMQNNLIS